MSLDKQRKAYKKQVEAEAEHLKRWQAKQAALEGKRQGMGRAIIDGGDSGEISTEIVNLTTEVEALKQAHALARDQRREVAAALRQAEMAEAEKAANKEFDQARDVFRNLINLDQWRKAAQDIEKHRNAHNGELSSYNGVNELNNRYMGREILMNRTIGWMNQVARNYEKRFVDQFNAHD